MQDIAIAVIRHSLNAAQAALELINSQPKTELELIDSQPKAVHSILETVPFVDQNFSNVEVEQSQPVQTPLELTLTELNDPRYKLRTLSELCSVLGFDPRNVLYDAGVEFIMKTRRADGASLIGLKSRN